jgi:magnesium transporter
MMKKLKILDGRLVETDADDAQVFVYLAPDEGERKYLVETMKIDEHTLTAALDPDELSLLEFEPDHMAVIFKRARNYSSEDNFLFRVISTGLFLFSDRLIVVRAEEAPLFDGRQFQRVTSLQDIILKLIYRAVFHFEEHLKVIHYISGQIEQEINTAMENKHLLNLFTLEKSLTYYLNAIASNNVLVEKFRAPVNVARIGFTPENLELIDDILIETNQCQQQANIYANILASLMDARASIVANNLNVLMKTLNIIMIALMLPTLVVSIFSMNVPLPLPQTAAHSWPFWFIVALATLTVIGVWWVWWKKRL